MRVDRINWKKKRYYILNYDRIDNYVFYHFYACLTFLLVVVILKISYYHKRSAWRKFRTPCAQIAVDRGSRTYLPLVRWDFIAGLGPRSFNLKPNSSRGWNAGNHRSGRIARRVARLVVVCYPPTPASPVPPSTFLSSYPSFRRRILKHPCFTGGSLRPCSCFRSGPLQVWPRNEIELREV